MIAHSDLIRRFYAKAWIYDEQARHQFIKTFADDEGFDKRAGDMIWASAKGFDWLSCLARITAPDRTGLHERCVRP